MPGSASYDATTKQYTINSAGYNIWYTRDEFRYLWKKMSGDVSFAANVSFPVAQPPHDRKVVLMIRQDLDDNSKEIMAAEHEREWSTLPNVQKRIIRSKICNTASVAACFPM